MSAVQVTSLSVQDVHTAYQVYGVYRFKPRRWAWLARIAWRLVEHLGALWPYMGEVVRYETTTLHLDDIVQAIFESREQVYALTGRECRYILVGRDQQRRLRIECHNFLTYEIPDDYQAPVCGMDPHRFAGMTIVLVPWMDGLVLVPGLEAQP